MSNLAALEAIIGRGMPIRRQITPEERAAHQTEAEQRRQRQAAHRVSMEPRVREGYEPSDGPN